MLFFSCPELKSLFLLIILSSLSVRLTAEIEIPPITKLESYNVYEDAITVSGFSSGASMATHLHIAHSSLFHGAALFSQSFYRCGPNSLVEFGIQCTKIGYKIFPYNLKSAIQDAKLYEKQGLIDPLVNLKGQKVFLWTGELDEYIPTEMGYENTNFYGTFISNRSQISKNIFHATHLFPTTDFGDKCDQDASKNVYLGDCDYSGAYQALEFLLKDKAKLVNPFVQNVHRQAHGQLGTLMAYNQSEFYKGKDIREAAMGNLGFIYVPQQCQNSSGGNGKRCFLHINFHGCEEWEPKIALKYIMNNGFLPVADANDVILVFPLSTKVPENMNGCWDFFSYTDSLFATKMGKQVKVAKSIIDRIIGKI